MAYTIQWHTDKRILYERIHGDVTFDELEQMRIDVKPYLAAGIEPIHTLIDVRDIEHYPQVNLKELVGSVKIEGQQSNGWVILITSNKAIRFLASIVFQLNGRRSHAVSSIEAALAFILERDGTLAAAEIAAHVPQRESQSVPHANR